MPERFCKQGHDTQEVGTDSKGRCVKCRNAPSKATERDREFADEMLRLTRKLEYCMSWERLEVINEIKMLQRRKGSTQ